MFLFSVASELSNYESCQSVQKWRGVRFERSLFCSPRDEKFTNFSQNFCLWRVNANLV
ncbi:hypothetical protein NP493_5g03023 [Ridgeia piscesae]|uniref:Uncharacterized protein n=1 Tax=Ridgeia piscesae TaxID=27915 RepID=A0AAD9ULL3_RIDPI|nr:hypothetical protein NP493_5g03023 [Ridgeia piscesae]